MQTYEFYAIPENGYLPIPEQYKGKIKKNVKVIVLDEKTENLKKENTAIHFKTDLLLPPSYDTRGWKFDREEANAR